MSELDSQYDLTSLSTSNDESMNVSLSGQAAWHGEVKLERILGLTVSSNAALACESSTGLVAYPAGCTVVLFNPRKNRQSHLSNPSRKTITALDFSADGRHLVTGECGHQPAVRIWDVQERVQVAEFSGHKYGVVCVAFSPNLKYVVSVGSQHDMIVNVWDWKNGIKVASNKVSSKVKAVSFAENGSYFVTVGNRHVKFWYLEYSRSAKYKEPVPLMGRSAILGEQRNNYFCDVGCGRGEMGDSTYAITKSGLLCEFNNRRLLDKWVELRTTSANCLVVGEQYIFVGCADGIVRCFSPVTLQYITTLPRTHYLGVDVAKGLSITHMASHPASAKYPDTVAITLDEVNHKVTCVYSDRSLYVWDVNDIRKVGKSQSFLYHSACIWGVESYPSLKEGMKGVLPPGSFITCSSDDTIRVWNLDPNMGTNTVYRRNIYSNELLKTLYVDPELTFLKDQDLAAGGSAEKTDTATYDGRNGVRCIRVSPDGKHLASGDRAGNIRIHEMQFMDQLFKIEAHDAEVLCLEYSRPESGVRLLASASRDRLIHIFSVDQGYQFLQTLDDHSSSITSVRFTLSHGIFQMVSCGADKSLIFRQMQQANVNSQPQFVRGHNVVGKTTFYDMESDQSQKHILTACQDRQVRVYNTSSGKHSKTFRGSLSEDGTLIKLCMDSSGIYVATSCTDKTLCIYDYYSGECMASMYGHSELVTGLRFTNDGKHLISVSGDGCIFVWKLSHDMTVTIQARLNQQAARASKESKRRDPQALSPDLKIAENEEFGSPPPELLEPNVSSPAEDEPGYRFSVGQLPLWAKKQIGEAGTAPGKGVAGKGGVDPPKGRWVGRLDPSASGIKVKSVYQGDSVIPFPAPQGGSADSDGSKDSSLESNEFRSNARENSLFPLREGELDEFTPCPESLEEIERSSPAFQIPSSKITRRGGESSAESGRGRTLTDDSSTSSLKMEDFEGTEHDGDVEDYSDNDGESTEPEHMEKLMYYPQNEETSSDYTVNAMDVEELRRSQRRFKKTRGEMGLSLMLGLGINPPSTAVSISGSQDSDDDDDEVSTPSAEAGERNMLSILSVSMESLDRVGRRESYLKSTFESLSSSSAAQQHQVAESDMDMTVVSGEVGKEEKSHLNSLSSQFLTKSTGSSTGSNNAAVISALKATQRDPEAVRKREELQKKIEETRRKLQSIGYKSNLRNSQSITDLREGSSPLSSPAAVPLENSTGPRAWGTVKERDDSAESDSESQAAGLRRACSLSDLSKPSPRRILPSPPNNVSGKLASRGSVGGPQQSSLAKRTPLRPAYNDLPRSSSMGILHQASDSDSENPRSKSSAAGVNSSASRTPVKSSRTPVSSAMRPTISSANKSAATKSVTVATRNAQRRLTGAVSTGDIQQALNESSSSSEDAGSAPESKTANVKARVLNYERSVSKTPTPKRPQSMIIQSGLKSAMKPQETAMKPQAVETLSRDSCESAVGGLKSAADQILQLQRKLAGGSGSAGSDLNLSDRERAELLQYLASAVTPIVQSLKILQNGSQTEEESDADSNSKPNIPNPPQTAESNPMLVQMMQQYSDLLLSMVQQKINVPNQQPPS